MMIRAIIAFVIIATVSVALGTTLADLSPTRLAEGSRSIERLVDAVRDTPARLGTIADRLNGR